jgi:pyruvate-ferredoxin/flavodoxin oxidoreductase
MEQHLRGLLKQAPETANVRQLMDQAIETTVLNSKLDDNGSQELRQEFGLFREELGEFQFALSRPYFTVPEQQANGDGGLLCITVNPNTCKGCMECIEVCDDDALRPIPQTVSSIDRLRKEWDFWLDLPSTPKKYMRVDDLEQGIGALHTILLDKSNYLAMTSGDGACLGCGEKTVVHLFVAAVEALMQPRIKQHVEKLKELIAQLERHIQLRLVHEIDVGDSATIASALTQMAEGDVTLARIAEHVERVRGGEPIDQEWLRRVTRLVSQLKTLKERYESGITGQGRARMGFLNATGCSSVWGSTFPFNPYPFPWANHLFQDPASMALGVFEGHMAKMAEGFKAIRLTELELSGQYQQAEHDEFFTYFNWQQFSDEEWKLCPPVVVVGGDGAMYDIGFQNLSRALMSGKPIKVLVLDTQVYSNTGGQACTSGFLGGISDMAQYGKALKGKEEIRKEIGLIGMAHRNTYVMQSTIAYPQHMIEGFVQGLLTRRPALFNLYTSCQPEHGIGDDMSTHQAKLAVESRAYPLFRYNPDLGELPQECFDLEGNPEPEQEWPIYTLRYQEAGQEKTMDLPMTFADFAVTEVRFRKHFRVAPPDTWNDNMVPLADFLKLSEDERQDMFPFVWSIDRKQQLTRLLVAQPIVKSCEERRHFWNMLRAIARVGERQPSREEIAAEVRQELTARIAAGLHSLMQDGGAADFQQDLLSPVATAPATPSGTAATAASPAAPTASQASGDHLAPWIDTALCTSCDECIKLNPNIFQYNEDKKAIIKNPSGGPYRDLVKAAERCTAHVIHPGLPKDRSDKDIEKWIARAKKYN